MDKSYIEDLRKQHPYSKIAFGEIRKDRNFLGVVAFNLNKLKIERIEDKEYFRERKAKELVVLGERLVFTLDDCGAITSEDTRLVYLGDNRNGNPILINKNGEIFESEAGIDDIEYGIVNIKYCYKNHPEQVFDMDNLNLKLGYTKVLYNRVIEYENTGYNCIDFSEYDGARVLKINPRCDLELLAEQIGDTSKAIELLNYDDYVIVVGGSIRTVEFNITASSAVLILLPTVDSVTFKHDPCVCIVDKGRGLIDRHKGTFIERDTSTKFWKLDKRENSKLLMVAESNEEYRELVETPVYLNYKDVLKAKPKKTRILEDVYEKLKPQPIPPEIQRVLNNYGSETQMSRDNTVYTLRMLLSAREDVKDLFIKDGDTIARCFMDKRALDKLYIGEIDGTEVKIFTIRTGTLGNYHAIVIDDKLYGVFEYLSYVNRCVNYYIRKQVDAYTEVKIGDRPNGARGDKYIVLDNKILRAADKPLMKGITDLANMVIESGQCFKTTENDRRVIKLYDSYKDCLADQERLRIDVPKYVGKESLQRKLKLVELIKAVAERDQSNDEIVYEYQEMTDLGEFILNFNPKTKYERYERNNIWDKFGIKTHNGQDRKRLMEIQSRMIKLRKELGITSMNKDIKRASTLHRNVSYIYPFGLKLEDFPKYYERLDESDYLYINMINGELAYRPSGGSLVVRLKSYEDSLWADGIMDTACNINDVAGNLLYERFPSFSALTLNCYGVSLLTGESICDSLMEKMYRRENVEITKLIREYGFKVIGDDIDGK